MLANPLHTKFHYLRTVGVLSRRISCSAAGQLREVGGDLLVDVLRLGAATCLMCKTVSSGISTSLCFGNAMDAESLAQWGRWMVAGVLSPRRTRLRRK